MIGKFLVANEDHKITSLLFKRSDQETKTVLTAMISYLLHSSIWLDFLATYLDISLSAKGSGLQQRFAVVHTATIHVHSCKYKI